LINLPNRVIFQALECGPHPTVIADARKPGTPINYVNPAFEALTGHESGALIGSPLSKLVSEGDLPAVENGATGRFLAIDRRRMPQRWRVRNGGPISVDVHISALYESPGRPSYLMLTLSNGTAADPEATLSEDVLHHAIQDARRKLRYLNRSDSTTGLPNSKAFAETFQRDWNIACRQRCRLGVVFFRIDALDDYCDLFGRHATDVVLRKVGHAISGSLRRAGDLAARFDHGRFIALVGGIEQDEAQALARRIQAKVRNLCEHHPRSPARYVTVSFGYASEIPVLEDNPDSLIDKAEANLEGKHSGKSTGKTAGKASG
jgi:diguanylate cyclase (GGDEF)-like protein/PAS domain S-box-containing protein